MIEKKEVEYAKELDDVMDLIVELVKVIKEKGDYTTLMSDLISAVSGIDQVDDEIKENLKASINTVLFRAVEIADIFIKK